MSLYNDVVAQIKKHQAESEAAFTKFINTSKKLIGGLNVPKDDNQKRYSKMQGEVDSLKDLKPGSDDYGDLLESNQDYQEIMSNVSLEFSAKQREQRLTMQEEQQQKRLEASEKYIKKQTE